VGDLVSVNYKIRDPTGEPLPESANVIDQGDVRFIVGSGGYIPGLHTSVMKLENVGEEATFEVSPEEAFGEADPAMGPVEVPKTQAPDGLAVGDAVRLSNGLKARVTAVTDAAVTIDANAPLAGRELELTVTLREAPVGCGKAGVQMATVAAGCFWGIELAYQRLPGVLATEVGYAQGQLEEPDYKTVCSGSTGHTEAVRVLFEPSIVSYCEVCDLFWERLGESRYLLNQVGNDRGTQYRHGLYPHNEEQMAIAKASLEAAQAAAGAGETVHTEIEMADVFWRAEEYHQQYLQKGGQSARKEAIETIRCYG